MKVLLLVRKKIKDKSNFKNMGAKTVYTALGLVMCVFPFINVVDTSQITSVDISNLEDFVENVMKCRKVTGASITLVKDDKILLSKGFGHSSIEQDVSATSKTKFCIGSLTKAFTSTILAKLLSQQTRYTWDTPIREILGSDFRLIDRLRTENVNLRDLLAHKVGVPGYFNALIVGMSLNITREDLIRMLQYQPASKLFRTSFLYSNFMYTLAGYVAEQIGGASWETLVREILFEPLGMKDSGFVNEINQFTNFASMYTYYKGNPIKIDDKLLYSVDPLGPAGSIFSTSEDMGKWILFHLSEGKNSTGSRLIPQDALKEMHIGQMAQAFSGGDVFRPTYPIDDVSMSYNLAWVTSTYRGYKRIWHSGGIVGFSSLLWLFPAKNAGIFVSITGSKDGSSIPIKMVMNRAADLLLGESPWLNDTTACTFPEPWETTPTKKSKNENISVKTIWNLTKTMENYVGVYGHPAFGNITVSIENDTNLILYFGRFGRLVLNPVSETSFTALYSGSLWYVNQGDAHEPLLTVNFNFTKRSGKADILIYPVDNAKTVEFKRGNHKDNIPIYTDSPCFISSAFHITGRGSVTLLVFQLVLFLYRL